MYVWKRQLTLQAHKSFSEFSIKILLTYCGNDVLMFLNANFLHSFPSVNKSSFQCFLKTELCTPFNTPRCRLCMLPSTLQAYPSFGSSLHTKFVFIKYEEVVDIDFFADIPYEYSFCLHPVLLRPETAFFRPAAVITVVHLSKRNHKLSCFDEQRYLLHGKEVFTPHVTRVMSLPSVKSMLSLRLLGRHRTLLPFTILKPILLHRSLLNGCSIN